MTPERIKEIQKETAYPDSVSVQQALLKVWNECEQDKKQLLDSLHGVKPPTLEYDLKKLLLELKELYLQYESGEETSLYYRGKTDAYKYLSSKLKDLLHWHGVIDLNESL